MARKWGRVVVDAAGRDAAICRRLRAGGVTVARLAREYGLSGEAVRVIAAKGGLSSGNIPSAGVRLEWLHSRQRKAAIRATRAERKARKRALIDAVVEMRRRGASQTAIAIAFKVSQAAVSGWLIAEGMRTISERRRRAA